MLRSILQEIPCVNAPGEVSNASSENIRTDELSFLRFRANACNSNADFFYATEDAQSKLLDLYLESVRKAAKDTNLIVLDIKYSHVHNFNACWWDMSTRPFLLEYARKKKIRILHLVREKIYQTAVSNLYARESGIWRAYRPDQVAHIKFTVDRNKLENKAKRLARTIDLFDEWLVGCRHLRLTYEALINAPRPTLRKLRNFLILDNEIRNGPTSLKTTPPYEEAFENFEQIADLLDIELKNFGGSRRFSSDR